MTPQQEQYILENIGRQSTEAMAKTLGVKERKIKRFLERQKSGNGRPAAPTPRMEKKKAILSVVLIIALGFAAYGNSIRGAFLYDDETLVTDNRFITSWRYLPDIFKEDIGAGAGKESNPYRPLQILSYRIDYLLWGLDAKGYHLTNVVCHVLAALSLCWLINLLFGDWLLSLWTSLFFVVHPVHTQAVSYVAGRADSLALLFMLACFILYIRQASGKNIFAYFLMILSYGLAMFSRENSLILPVVILLYHYAFEKRILLKEYLSLLAMACGYLLLRAVFFSYLMPETPLHNTTLFERLPGFFVAMAKYARLLVWPVDLHMEYGDKLFKLSDPGALAGAVLLSFLILCVARKGYGDRVVFFAALWFLATLLPSSNIYPINAYMAEHWLYVPSIGAFLVAAKGLRALGEKDNLRKFVIVMGGAVLCFYAFLTFRQNAVYWRDPVAFYQRTVRYAPDSFHAYNNLGKLYHGMGRKEEAVGLFKKAVEVNPREANAYNNLAAVSYEAGKNEDYIIGLLENAVKFDPYHAKARYNLGKLYKDIGQNEKALPQFEKAIELDPNYVEAHEKLGAVYEDLGKREDAVRSLKRSVEIDPSYSLAHTNLAIAYYHNGQYDLAVEHYRMARALGFEISTEFSKAIEPYLNQ